ncbi:MAG: hypothetical protein KUA43_11515 [Hoeflea sp.]|uniref:hypothetical protein n=1 Tax=Hoeflea sp. TaxID=1940281 RepID=UPI001D35E79A|nr:hypothetical protein [Hoeflea sp.]MBU4527638.1 hypothetical protein [Alphaproteobacteria bacterium]MBU4546494.1 hypothetical protein [Alphaproteobacteria bacterium]MBU4552988.1 hypothetical protein [Alphaproteobacteria bacterium]MBV1724060.1 hypothetical protein [Hoeflea sp.]MBV1759745.1 hypothetical protein [Hoeflea sp.]
MTTAKTNPVSRFFSGVARSISFATQADRLANTPDHVFQARGTTRQREIRNLLDRL